MRYRLAIAVSVILISAMALAQPAPSESGQKLGGTESSARISREVMHELLMNPYYNVFDNLEYKVDGDTVVLMGQVTDPVVKSDAMASVRRVEGVANVKDEIEVLPPSPMDSRIRRQLYYSVYGFDGLGRYSMGTNPAIHFIVDNGHVTLVGEVDSQTDKNIAGIRANSVPGVFSVTNDLRVRSESAGKTQTPVKGKNG